MPDMWVWIVLGAALAVLAVVLLVASRRRRSPGAPSAPATDTATDSQAPSPDAVSLPRAAVIVNPTKFDDVESVHATVDEVCREHGWAESLWIETTADDPGSGQTKQAIAAGVHLVCPLGGDGTVRTVASELTSAGAPVPLGLLPGGTGNLLARNLDLPVDSLRDALTIALTGKDRRIDVGLLTVTPEIHDGEHEVDDEPTPAASTPPQDSPDEELHFLVMAGMGFDADVMADAPEKLKATMGWPAYVVSGARHLWGRQFKAQVSTENEILSRRTRSVLIGNCGKIQGLALMPDAKVDDGMLDTLVLSPDGGVGWAAVAVRLLTAQRKGHHRVTHHTSRHVDVHSDRLVQVQVDGDTIGQRRHVRATVLPEALLVRVDPRAGATATDGQRDCAG